MKSKLPIRTKMLAIINIHKMNNLSISCCSWDKVFSVISIYYVYSCSITKLTNYNSLIIIQLIFLS